MIGQYIGFHPSLSLLLMRLALGYIMIIHGYQKLFSKGGLQQFTGFLKNINVPAPLSFAYIVGATEFFGGILLTSGLFTRLAAVAIAINLLVAVIKVKIKTGLITKVMPGNWVGGYELDLALIIVALSLVLLGAGKFSIDHMAFHQW